MPAFVLPVSVNLHELLKNRSTTSNTFGGKPCGVMEMAIHVGIMLVVRVLGAKEGITKRASEVLDMELFAACGDITTT